MSETRSASEYTQAREPTLIAALPRSSLRKAEYVHGVDALRALAVLLVIAAHTSVIGLGWAGVWMFFVISGFAITTSLQMSDQTSGNWLSLQHFYIRRCLRIWPLYFAFILANVAILIWLGRFSPLWSIPWLVSFTYNFDLIFASNWSHIDWPPFALLWSLSVEEQFYFIYPALFLYASRRTTIRVLFMVIAGAPLVRTLIAYYTLHAG